MLEFLKETILSYWVEWVCIGFSTLLCFTYRSLAKRFREEREINIAMREGMKALLHDRIIEKCEKCLTKGHCTTDDMDEIIYSYTPYKALNGNGSAERIFGQVKELPTQPV